MKRTVLAFSALLVMAIASGECPDSDDTDGMKRPYRVLLADHQFRFCDDTGVCKEAAQVTGGSNKPKAGWQTLPEIEYPGGKTTPLVFVEYDQGGQPWDRVQGEVAKLIIERARAEIGRLQPVHLLLYVHGWQNSADKSDKPKSDGHDVEKFCRYVEQYTDSLVEPAPPVVAIYLSWHGKTLNFNHGFHFPSFWTRSASARLAGESGGPLYHDVQCFIELARAETFAHGRPGQCGSVKPKTGKREIAQQSPGNPQAQLKNARDRSRVILLGHSFGARVLEATFLNAEPDEGPVEGACRTLVKGQARRPFVDLFVLENAATGAHFIRRQFVNCQPCGSGRIGCKDIQKDGLDFSDAVMVRSFAFDKKFCEEGENYLQARCQPYPLMIVISGKADVTTRFILPLASGSVPAAFLPSLQTHTADPVLPSHQVHPENRDVVTFDIRKDNGQIETFLIRRKDRQITPANPIWTMAVPSEIIANHGDVWNDGYLNFQLNLLCSLDSTTCTQYKNYDQNLKRIVLN